MEYLLPCAHNLYLFKHNDLVLLSFYQQLYIFGIFLKKIHNVNRYNFAAIDILKGILQIGLLSKYWQ